MGTIQFLSFPPYRSNTQHVYLYYEKGNILQEINALILKNQVTLARGTTEGILLRYLCHLKLLNNCERGEFGE